MPKPMPQDVKPILSKLLRLAAKAARYWAGGFTAAEIAALAVDLIEIAVELAQSAKEDDDGI
jgi:hypothetical protein